MNRSSRDKKRKPAGKNSPEVLLDQEIIHCLHGTLVAIQETLDDYLRHRSNGHGPAAAKALKDLCQFCVTLGRLHREAQRRRLNLAQPRVAKKRGGYTRLRRRIA